MVLATQGATYLIELAVAKWDLALFLRHLNKKTI